MGRVRLEASHRQIAQVLDRKSGLAERAEQPGLAERSRRLLLAGAVRAGAGWDADQAEHFSTLPRPERGRASDLGASVADPQGGSLPTSPIGPPPAPAPLHRRQPDR